MQSVGSFFSTVSKLYSEINPATLSGAIDIVVVEQPNGDLACSPFHVRFGKLSILRPQEKVVCARALSATDRPAAAFSFYSPMIDKGRKVEKGSLSFPF